MSSTINMDGSAEPHILCGYCRATCDNSVIIQTYTRYGNDENDAALKQRCIATKSREAFNHCFLKDFKAGYRTGCHLCTMLWRPSLGDEDTESKLLQERKEFEEKNGTSQSVLKIDCEGGYNSVEIALSTWSKDSKTLYRGFTLRSYLIRDFQVPLISPTFPVQTSRRPTAKQAAALIKFWLKECAQSHENCYLHISTMPAGDIQPTRLIDVSNVNHVWLHTRNLRPSRQITYLTLSHCWPSDGQIYKLTEGNLNSLKKRIPLDQLTQTFKDAIAVTNALGVRYLWIDSLCIIQDSPNDWAVEADLMTYVYGNAALNLVACGPSGATMFESRNPLRYYPCRVSTQNCSLFVEPHAKAVEEIPAFKRGWIVQERLLSRRTIYFGMKSQLGEMTWECFQGHATETSPVVNKVQYDDLVRPQFIRDTDHKAFFARLLNTLLDLQNDSIAKREEASLDFSRMWTRIMSIYTQTELTYASDKLVAIAGIAGLISSKQSLDYVAGMWMFTLPSSLLWLTGNRGRLDPLPERPAWRGAPSWSWASLDTEIDGNWPELLDRSTSQGFENFHAIVIDCERLPVTGKLATFGEYASAKLRIASILRQIREINTGEDPETDGSKEFGSNLVKKVLFLPDVSVPASTSLFYFTIFRGWAANMYDSFKWFKEEGLVLMPFEDGYVRVGYMRVLFEKDEKEDVFNDMLWGSGKLEKINIY